MNAGAFDFCMAVAAAHARLQRKLDDELGTFHGLSFADFRLLAALAEAPAQRLGTARLAELLGLQPSAALRHVLPLEKNGWIAREVAAGARHVALRAPGQRLQREAAETVAAVCGSALRELGPAGPMHTRGALDTIADSPALELR